jgi:hypothetical protein
MSPTLKKAIPPGAHSFFFALGNMLGGIVRGISYWAHPSGPKWLKPATAMAEEASCNKTAPRYDHEKYRKLFETIPSQLFVRSSQKQK